MKKFSLLKQGLPAAFIVLSAAIFTWAQDSSSKQNIRPDRTPPPATNNTPVTNNAKYSYEFSQPKFYVKHLVLEHDETGHGTITFERMNEDVPVVEPIELSSTVLGRVTSLWASLDFLNSQTNYQSSQDFSHLGTMRIGMQQGMQLGGSGQSQHPEPEDQRHTRQGGQAGPMMPLRCVRRIHASD